MRFVRCTVYALNLYRIEWCCVLYLYFGYNTFIWSTATAIVLITTESVTLMLIYLCPFQLNHFQISFYPMRRERERERFDRGASKTNAEQLADSFFIVIGMNDAVANTNLPYFSSMSFLPLSLSLCRQCIWYVKRPAGRCRHRLILFCFVTNSVSLFMH